MIFRAGNPRREHAFALLAFALMLLLSFPDVVFFGRTLQTSALKAGVAGPSGPWGYHGHRPLRGPVVDAEASATTYEPSTFQVHDALGRGEIPYWNTRSAFGEPFAANFLTGIYAPLRWPVFLFPTEWMQDAYLLLRLWLAAFLAYLFLREIQVGWLGAATGGAIFGLSGYFVLLVNMVHLDVEIWLPLVLLALEKLCRAPSARTMAWLALATALAVFGGNPESVAVLLSAAGLYLAYRSRLRVDVLSLGAIGFLLGILLAAPLLVPGIEYVAHGVHTKPPAAGLEHDPTRTFALALVPDFFGPLNATWDLMGPMTRWCALGIVPWTLGLAGLAARRKDGAQWFFSGLLVVCVMKIHGWPPVQWIGHLPLLRFVLFTKHLQPVIALCIGALAAFALDRLARENAGRRALVVAAGVTSAVVSVFVLRYRKAAGAAGAWPPTLHAVIVEMGFLAIAIGVASWPRLRFGATFAAIGCVACLWMHVPRDRPERYDPSTPPPFVDALRSDPSHPRIAGFDGLMSPNWAAVFGLDDLRFLNGLSVATSTEWIRKRVEPMVFDRFSGTDSPEPDLFGTAIDQSGVRYLLSIRPIEEHATRFLASRARRPFPEKEGFRLVDRSRTNGVALRVDPERPHELEISLPLRAARLRASVASTASDARVRVEVERLSTPRVLYRRFLDPVSRTADRRWFDETVAVPAGDGYLSLRTDPGPNGNRRFDRICWADPRTPADESLAPNGLADFRIAAPGVGFAERSTVSLSGDSRVAITQRTPCALNRPIHVGSAGARLAFAVGFHPDALRNLQCDGAGCELAWQERGQPATLFDDRIGSGGRLVDVDLDAFRGQTILLRLVSDDVTTEWSQFSPELFGRTLEETFDRNDVHVYRNPHALPRAYFVPESGVVTAETRDDAVARTADPSFDARRSVILEREPSDAASEAPRNASTGLGGSVRIATHDAEEVSLEISAETDGRCVLLDAAYPGWRATLDDVEVPVRRANGAFRSVAVPRGEHRLRFVYRPASLRLGLGLFACAALALGTMAWKSKRSVL